MPRIATLSKINEKKIRMTENEIETNREISSSATPLSKITTSETGLHFIDTKSNKTGNNTRSNKGNRLGKQKVNEQKFKGESTVINGRVF